VTIDRSYRDIPGTYVQDGEHTRKGYWLNEMLMTLNKADARAAFAADERAYVARFALTNAQRQAVLERDWLAMLQLGGNVYYLLKLAAHDGVSVQHMAGQMGGVDEETFRSMMIGGGRSIEGNRSKREIG
jgi:protocatechuate 4,5-dioxygenase, alpha chain